MNDSDFAWIVEHNEELAEQYRGKWIAVRDGKVVGSGDTATEAADQARIKTPDGQFLLQAIDDEADVIYGGE